MKINYVFLLLSAAFVLFSCKDKPNTEPDVAPEVTFIQADSIKQTSVHLFAKLNAMGSAQVTELGFCLGINADPDTSDMKYEFNLSANPINEGETFDMKIEDLEFGETYQLRAYAINSAGISYSDAGSFTLSSTFALGIKYGGGYICYLDGTNLHGLIAADTQIFGFWGCEGTSISGASGAAIGTGQQNTTAITNACSNSAAYWSDRLDYRGYDDWFLPSEAEGTTIHTNLGSKSIRTDVFLNVHIWTSTQIDKDYARTVRLSDGGSQNQNKNSIGKYIPVRVF